MNINGGVPQGKQSDLMKINGGVPQGKQSDLMKISGGVPQGEQSVRPNEDQRWSPPRRTICPT